MSRRRQLDDVQRGRERALEVVLLLDVGAAAGLIVFGILADSITLLADGLRGTLVMSVEIYALITLRKIHRGRFAEYDYGTGKIERLVNVAIAFSLLVAAVWIAWTAVGMLDRPAGTSSVFFAFAVLIAEFNLAENVYGYLRFQRANRGRSSIIIESQIAARRVKALSSLVVFGVVLASGLVPDPTVGNFLDIVGSLFVCVMMAQTAFEQLRESVPDLLDRSLADSKQAAIYSALVDRFDDYEDLLGVRSRRSGQQLLVEVELGFRPDATVATVARVQADLTEQIRATLPGVRISVVPTVVGPDAG